jgi:hypothetical protein
MGKAAYEIKDWSQLCEPKNWHPAANMFPLMNADDGELAGLVESIKSTGLLNPIVMLDGKVLDGRNRLLACKLAEVTPRFVEWDGSGGSLEEWVVAQNANRRNLNPSQKAVAALYVIRNFNETPAQKERFCLGGRKWDRRIFICNMFGGIDRHFCSDVVAIEDWTRRVPHKRWNDQVPSRLRPDVLENIKTGLQSISSTCRMIEFWNAQAKDPTITEPEIRDCPTGQLASEFVAVVPKVSMELAYADALRRLKGDSLVRLKRYWERMGKEYAPWGEKKES